jgi:coatomer subunit beta'
VYSYEQDTYFKSFDAHNSCITTLAVHPTDSFVLSSSDDDDHMIKLWDWNKDWKCTRTFQGHTDRVTQVTYNPKDKDSFASASWDGTVKVGYNFLLFIFVYFLISRLSFYMHL